VVDLKIKELEVVELVVIENPKMLVLLGQQVH
jgi:hypothetical protein